MVPPERRGPRPALGGRFGPLVPSALSRKPESGSAWARHRHAPSHGEGRARTGLVARAKGGAGSTALLLTNNRALLPSASQTPVLTPNPTNPAFAGIISADSTIGRLLPAASAMVRAEAGPFATSQQH